MSNEEPGDKGVEYTIQVYSAMIENQPLEHILTIKHMVLSAPLASWSDAQRQRLVRMFEDAAKAAANPDTPRPGTLLN